MEAFAALLHQTLIVTALLCLPVLAAATLVGAAVAIVQAATQVQEQTLSLLPKLVVVAVCVAAFGTFGMHLCAELFTNVIAQIPRLAGS